MAKAAFPLQVGPFGLSNHGDKMNHEVITGTSSVPRTMYIPHRVPPAPITVTVILGVTPAVGITWDTAFRL